MPGSVVSWWGCNGVCGPHVHVLNPDESLGDLPSARPLRRIVTRIHDWGEKGDAEAGYRLAYDILAYAYDHRTAIKLHVEFFHKVIRKLDADWWFDLEHLDRWVETVRANQEERRVNQ
jgi:hypothetical protein